MTKKSWVRSCASGTEVPCRQMKAKIGRQYVLQSSLRARRALASSPPRSAQARTTLQCVVANCLCFGPTPPSVVASGFTARHRPNYAIVRQVESPRRSGAGVAITDRTSRADFALEHWKSHREDSLFLALTDISGNGSPKFPKNFVSGSHTHFAAVPTSWAVNAVDCVLFPWRAAAVGQNTSCS